MDRGGARAAVSRLAAYDLQSAGAGPQAGICASEIPQHAVFAGPYGLKRLAKVEMALERRQKLAAQRYQKRYPGEMLHFDTKRLPLLIGEKRILPREYLFVAIDDCSRELYAAILLDKTQQSAAAFLEQVIEECPYTLECAYSDNGTE